MWWTLLPADFKYKRLPFIMCVDLMRSVSEWKSFSHVLFFATWDSPGHSTGVGSLSLLQGTFPTQGWNTRSPALQTDSLSAEPQGKPKNTGEFSLSLLQGLFLAQKLNEGLLHYRQILYQLSYQGSPRCFMWRLKYKNITRKNLSNYVI